VRWWGRGIACLVLTVAGVSGCAGMFKRRLPLETVQITAEPEANNTTPVLVHLVVVFDPDLLKELGKLKGPQYFERANDIFNDHPDMLEITAWDMAPGQVAPDRSIVIRGNAPLGALVFARMMTPGDHRIKVGKKHHLKLRLTPQAMVMVPDPPARKKHH
jgi:hypothetical protein